MLNGNSWNIDGLQNAGNLLKAFLTKYKVDSENKFLNTADANDLIVYAYCLALGNYFGVQKANKIAQKALEKNKSSYAISS